MIYRPKSFVYTCCIDKDMGNFVSEIFWLVRRPRHMCPNLWIEVLKSGPCQAGINCKSYHNRICFVELQGNVEKTAM